MVKIIFETIMWILSIYGLIEIIKLLIVCKLNNIQKDNNIHIIVTVKNQENNIEGFIRTVMLKSLKDNMKKILVVDLNSKDKTKEILQKLSEENEIINLVTWEECKSIVEKENT